MDVVDVDKDGGRRLEEVDEHRLNQAITRVEVDVVHSMRDDHPMDVEKVDEVVDVEKDVVEVDVAHPENSMDVAMEVVRLMDEVMEEEMEEGEEEEEIEVDNHLRGVEVVDDSREGEEVDDLTEEDEIGSVGIARTVIMKRFRGLYLGIMMMAVREQVCASSATNIVIGAERIRDEGVVIVCASNY